MRFLFLLACLWLLSPALVAAERVDTPASQASSLALAQHALDRAKEPEERIVALQALIEILQSNDDGGMAVIEHVGTLANLYQELSLLTSTTDGDPLVRRLRARARELPQLVAAIKAWNDYQERHGSSDPLSPPEREAEGRAIQSYERALAMFTKDKAPLTWMRIKLGLARLLLFRVDGDPAHNIDAAIANAQAVVGHLGDVTAAPREWALANSVLAQAYAKRQPGDRNANLDLAIAHGVKALEAFNSTERTFEWGYIQIDLSNALYQRGINGDRKFLKRSAEHARQALAVFTKAHDPRIWALVNLNRAKACFLLLPAGESTDINCAQDAASNVLEVINLDTAPATWADAKLTVAYALKSRWEKNDLDAGRRAFVLIDEVLASDLRVKHPKSWARFQIVLATMLIATNRPPTDRAKRAVDAATAALSVLSQVEDGQLWEAAQDVLRQAKEVLETGDAAERIAEMGLIIITGEEYPLEWAWFQSNENGGGSPKEAGSLLADIRATDPSGDPVRWAQQHLELAEIYLSRTIGEKEINRKLAEMALQEAIRTINAGSDAKTKAIAHGLKAIITGTDPNILPFNDRMDKAQAEVLEALKYVSPETNPQIWAALKTNLATTYLGQTPNPGSFEGAIDAGQAALDVLDRTKSPSVWITAMYDIANAHQRYAQYIALDKTEKLDRYRKAKAIYQTALDFIPQGNALREKLSLLNGVIRIEADLGEWTAVEATGRQMVEVADTLLAGIVGEEEMRDAIERVSPALSIAAYAAVQNGDYSRAMILLERSRAVTARKTAAKAEALPAATARELASLRAQLLALRGAVGLDAENRRLTLRSKIFSLRSVPLEPFDDMAPPAQTAFLTMVTTSNGGAVLLRTSEGFTVGMLPQRSYPVLAAQIFGSLGKSDASSWNWSDGSGVDTQADDLSAWIWPIVEAANLPRDTRILWVPPADLANVPIEAGRNPTTGEYLIDRFEVSTLSSFGLWKVASRNAEHQGRPLSVAGIFNPTGDLANAAVEETLIVGAAPELALAAVKPGTPPLDLLSEFEQHPIWHFATHNQFNWTSFLRSGIELGSNQAGVPQQLTLEDLIYFADVKSPSLVVITICDSGLTNVKHHPDESAGMSTAFLALGAGGVVSARWDVHDTATSLLVGRFYVNLLKQKLNPGAALREAQIWLRDATGQEIFTFIQELQATVPLSKVSETMQQLSAAIREKPRDAAPFAHPKYWAAFNFQGA